MSASSSNNSFTDDIRLLRHHQNAFNEIASKLIRRLEAGSDAGQKTPKITAIQEAVCTHYSLPLSVMSSKLRPVRFVEPRQVAMYLARELTNHPLTRIGYAFGGRDHGTVMHGCNVVVSRLASEPLFANQIATLREVCLNRLKDLDLPLFATKQIQSA